MKYIKYSELKIKVVLGDTSPHIKATNTKSTEIKYEFSIQRSQRSNPHNGNQISNPNSRNHMHISTPNNHRPSTAAGADHYR